MTPQHFQETGLAWLGALNALIPALTLLLMAVSGMLGAVLTRLHEVGKRQDRQGQALTALQLSAPPPAPAQAPAPASGPPGAAHGVSGQTFSDVLPPAPFDPNKTIIPGSAAPTGEM